MRLDVPKACAGCLVLSNDTSGRAAATIVIVDRLRGFNANVFLSSLGRNEGEGEGIHCSEQSPRRDE